MATHSSVLAWRISGTGEPGGLQSMGSHRVGHDWSDLAAAAEVVPRAEQEPTCQPEEVSAQLQIRKRVDLNFQTAGSVSDRNTVHPGQTQDRNYSKSWREVQKAHVLFMRVTDSPQVFNMLRIVVDCSVPGWLAVWLVLRREVVRIWPSGEMKSLQNQMFVTKTSAPWLTFKLYLKKKSIQSKHTASESIASSKPQ